MNRIAALALCACVLAAGCSGDAEPVSRSAGSPPTKAAAASPPRAPSAPVTPKAAASATAQVPFAADASAKATTARGGPLTVVAVRVANQGSYDRVVFELAGRSAGEPGWRVEYVDEPSADGSGDPVEVGGSAALAVRIEGAGYPYDTGAQEAEEVGGPGGARVVEDVVLGAVFEGVYEAWIGTSRKAPFRVFRLANPARVVVDIRHR